MIDRPSRPCRLSDELLGKPIAPACVREQVRKARDRERMNWALGLLVIAAVLFLARCVNDLTHNLADPGRRQSLPIKGGMR